MDINKLVPLLQCPKTRLPLELDEAGWLRSANGAGAYPIVRGVPVFTPEAEAIRVQPHEHLSNPLPDEAIGIIASCAGPVLNLSAGGTEAKQPNVVECEYTIFRNTDVAGDVHRLPFGDGVFDAVVCLNAFEHYRDPRQAATEVRRVLRQGGIFFMHTAALQPIHEPPHHYYNVTRYGLAEWLKDFSDVELTVSDNFNPGYSLAWIAAEVRAGLVASGERAAVKDFANAKLGELADLWTRPESRHTSALWRSFQSLPDETREACAAGWQARAVRR